MIDFKKSDKHLYLPATTPTLVDVPAMQFLAVDGTGDPNTSPAYAAAVQTLYALAYTIKMGNKQTLEWVVPPLEGLWDHPDMDISADKSLFAWTVMIRQPDFVTGSVLDAAIASAARKKSTPDLVATRLMPLVEGLCVQAMHIGPYDDEPATVAAMREFAAAHGYLEDSDPNRRHHEIYLADPRRTEPGKLRTVIRHPVKQVL